MAVIAMGIDVRRKDKGKLLQRGVKCVLELRDRNIEKSRADFRREAQQNSKNKAVPQQRLQSKEAAKLSGKQPDRAGSIRGARSSPKRGPDGLNQKTDFGVPARFRSSDPECDFLRGRKCPLHLADGVVECGAGVLTRLNFSGRRQKFKVGPDIFMICGSVEPFALAKLAYDFPQPKSQRETPQNVMRIPVEVGH
jgi:hypothetical protein